MIWHYIGFLTAHFSRDQLNKPEWDSVEYIAQAKRNIADAAPQQPEPYRPGINEPPKSQSEMFRAMAHGSSYMMTREMLNADDTDAPPEQLSTDAEKYTEQMLQALYMGFALDSYIAYRASERLDENMYETFRNNLNTAKKFADDQCIDAGAFKQTIEALTDTECGYEDDEELLCSYRAKEGSYNLSATFLILPPDNPN